MSETTLTIILLVSLIVVFVIVAVIIDVVVPYRRELKAIKLEISRSMSKREKTHWLHEKDRLRKKYFPILRLFK